MRGCERKKRKSAVMGLAPVWFHSRSRRMAGRCLSNPCCRPLAVIGAHVRSYRNAEAVRACYLHRNSPIATLQ